MTAILDVADQVLGSTAIEDFSLLAVAKAAGMPNASIYHFFPSAEAVLVGLLRRYLAAMDVLIADAISGAPAMDWQKFVRHLFEIIRTFYADNPRAARLVLQVGGFGGLQLVDDEHIADMASFAMEAFEARFHLPLIEDSHRRVAIAIAVSDRIWSMDVHEGQVSDFVFDESQRMIISYLANFLPSILARREPLPPKLGGTR